MQPLLETVAVEHSTAASITVARTSAAVAALQVGLKQGS
jgi:hypothetical protein